MEIAQQSATLSRDEYRLAVKILEQEQASLRLSRWQRVTYGFLLIAVYGWFLLLLAGLGIAFASGVFFSEQSEQSERLLGIATSALAASTIVGLLSAVALVFNLPLVFKIWSQARLVRRLGLQDVFDSEMLRRTKAARLGNLLSKTISIVGVFLVLAGLIVLIDSLVTVLAGGNVEGGLIAGAAILIAAGLSISSSYFIRRGRRRLKVAGEISGLLARFQTYAQDAESSDKEAIAIPSDAFYKLENVERQQIARDRKQTILAAASQPKEIGYFVQKSRQVRQAIDELPIETQLLVDNALDGLSGNPRPENAQASESGEYLWPLPGSPIDVRYALDEQERKIRLLRLEQQSAAPKDES